MYARILVPIDGSRPATRALREAIALAAEQRALVRFLHVVEPQAGLPGRSDALVPGDAIERLRQRGAAILREAGEAAAEQGVPAETVLAEATEGRTADAVLQEAARWPADLVVIGAHGCRGTSGLFLGSDAEAIARLSPAPVLLIRAGADVPEGGARAPLTPGDSAEP